MKRLAVALALVGPLIAATLQAQAPPTPGPEHKKLVDLWVGDWTMEGRSYTTPLGPAGNSSGKATVQSVLNGFFVEWHGEDKGPAGLSRWHEIDLYDPATKKFMWYGFDSGGGFQTVTYTIDGTNVAYAGAMVVGGKRYQVRGTAVFAPDLMSFIEKRELSLDGQTWMPFWESKATKTKAAAR